MDAPQHPRGAGGIRIAPAFPMWGRWREAPDEEKGRIFPSCCTFRRNVGERLAPPAQNAITKSHNIRRNRTTFCRGGRLRIIEQVAADDRDHGNEKNKQNDPLGNWNVPNLETKGFLRHFIYHPRKAYRVFVDLSCQTQKIPSSGQNRTMLCQPRGWLLL